MAPPYRSVGDSVARYLLYTTVGVVTLAVFVDVESTVPIGWLTLVTAGALAIAAVGRVVTGRNDGSSDTLERVQPPSPRVILAVLVALIIAGSLLRAYALGAQSLWFDEAISTNAAIAVLENGRPTFPSGQEYWRAFPHTLAMVASMALFGTGEAAARAPSVLFGVATIGVTYWLGREVGGPRVGLLAAALVTFASWEIAWSRQARMYQLLQLLYVLALVLLLRIDRSVLQDGRTRLEDTGTALALGVVVTLAALTHQIGYVLVPVAVAYLGLASAYEGRLSVRAAAGFLAGSAALVAVFEALGLEFTGAVETVATTDVSYWDVYVEWLLAEFHAFVFLGVVGAALTFYRGWYREGSLLVLAVAAPAWVLSFHTELFATRYLYFGLPVLFVWAGVTIEYVAIVGVGWFRTVRNRVEMRGQSVSRADGGTTATWAVPLVAFAFAVLLALGGGFTVVPQAEYELGVNAPQPEFEGAYEYVNEHREDGDVIVAGWTAPGVYYAGGVDYWLVHDLSGVEGNWTVDGEERFSGAEPIGSAAQLEAVINKHERGWIVVDEIALARQDGETAAALQEADLAWENGQIYVFWWDHSV